MKWNDKKQLELEPNELDLLAWSVANEVVNGFNVGDFQQQIGISEEEFKNVAKQLRATPMGKCVVIGAYEAEAFRNALVLTLEELGDDEFSTRTGHEYDVGKLILQELKSFLG
jgi:hypothetical protein